MSYHNAGTCPGKGSYLCVTCNYEMQIKTDSEQLYVCPKCGGCYFIKFPF